MRKIQGSPMFDGRAPTDHWWKPGSLWELRRKAQSWQCPTASPGRAHRAQWWTWRRRGRAEGLSLAQEERTQQKKRLLNCDVPDFVATRVEHVQVHVLHQNGRSALHGTTRQVNWCLRSFQTSRTGSSWVVARNVRHLCLRVGAEDLGPTLHWSVVVEVLLDLLHRRGSTVVGSVNWLSYSGGNVHNRSQHWSQPWQRGGAETTVALTLLFLHFHHLPLPLVKSGDVLRVFRAHTRICVCGDRGALGLSKIMRKAELGHFLWHGEENSSGAVGVPYLLHVRRVGLQVQTAGAGSRGQRRLRVGFGPSNVDVGDVLQDSWRTAVRWGEEVMSTPKRSESSWQIF